MKKMTMAISKILLLMASIFITASYVSVSAADTYPSIANVEIKNGNVLTITGKTGTFAIAGYYVGTSDNIGSSTYFEAPMLTTYRVSVKDGTYHVWVKDTQGRVAKYNKTISVNDSCKNESATNVTGTGSVERCYKFNGSASKPEINDPIVTCAPGYVLEKEPTVTTDTCSKLSPGAIKIYGLGTSSNNYIYCRKVHTYNCVKKASASDNTLKTLSIDNGTLSPAFASNVYSYKASVAANVSSIKISATLNDTNSKFADGFGPRAVTLKYGTNTIAIKVVSSSGDIKTYTLKITRQDNRSSENTLSSLSINTGVLSPTFQSSITNYQVTVPESVSSITVSATKTDSSSSFVSGYEPGTKSLNVGKNTISIRVKSEAGSTRTYNIVVTRGSSSSGTTVPAKKPLLSSLSISAGNIAFDPNVLDYNVTVPYEIQNVVVSATQANASDQLLITGGSNLEVGTNTVLVKVTDASGNESVYTIHVVRKEEDLGVSNSTNLASLEVQGYKIDFDKDTKEYKLAIKKGTTSLKINAQAESETSEVTVEGNENLKPGSEILIHVRAEDGQVSTYQIFINGYLKGTNWFVIIIIVILIILVVGYFVLRLMGYQFYFNLGAITKFFGGKKKE